MANSEEFLVEFTSRIGSYEQGVEALVQAHARLADRFDRTSRAGDRVEKQMLGLAGAQRRIVDSTAAAAKAQRELEKAQRDEENRLIRTRYALYDVASTYGVLGAALLGASGYAVTAAADFEKAFTGVERTLSTDVGTGRIGQIRDELIELSTQIPLTFQDITQIAQLGNQLGIAESGIVEFTETIAQFSAITGISVNEAALAFGQLESLLGITSDEYDNLASAIALVGVNSAATEAQIISVAREIAPAAAAAGFTADQVIGLSGALASIRVPPERSRSTILQFFETLNMAVANGGTDLQNFATAIGVTADELAAMVRAGQGEQIFRNFIDRAAVADTVEITQALEALGLAGLRTNPTIRALADNTALLDQAFSDAASGFASGTEQARQYALIADDLASRFQMLVNSVNALIVAATGGDLSGLSGLVQVLIDITNAIRGFVETPIGGFLSQVAIALAVGIGLWAAYRAAVSLATASTYALTIAQRGLAAQGVTSGLQGLIAAMLGYTGATNVATLATRALRTALITTGVGALIVGIGYLIQALVELSEAGGDVNVVLTKFVQELSWVYDAMSPLFRVVSAVTGNLSDMAGIAASLGVIMSRVSGSFQAAAAGVGNLGAVLGPVGNLLAGFARTAQIALATVSAVLGILPGAVARLNNVGTRSKASDLFPTAAAQDFSGALGDVGGAAGGAAKEIRTLLDYASDLGQVFDRSFDLRFGSQSAMDTITTTWMDLNEEIAEYRRQVQSLTADRAIKAYFLEVAEAYDDTLRAGVLRGEIADIDAEVAEATAGASTELNGNSKAAIQNRQRLTQLLQSYGDYIETLAAGGADQATLNAAVAQSEQEFLAQARALGYSDAQLQPYIQHFRDLTTAIALVPRNITVTANVNPAIQAYNELIARINRGGSANVPIGASADLGAASAAGAAIGRKVRESVVAELNKIRLREKSTGRIKDSGVDFYDTGGWTGAGSKFTPAGVVHKDEFVFTKKAVDNGPGVGAMYSMMRAFESGRGYAMGGYVAPVPVSSGAGFSALDPTTMSILRSIDRGIRENQPVIYIGDETVSRSAQRGNEKRRAMGEIA